MQNKSQSLKGTVRKLTRFQMWRGFNLSPYMTFGEDSKGFWVCTGRLNGVLQIYRECSNGGWNLLIRPNVDAVIHKELILSYKANKRKPQVICQFPNGENWEQKPLCNKTVNEAVDKYWKDYTELYNNTLVM